MTPYRRSVFQWGTHISLVAVLLLALTACSTLTRPPDVYQVEIHRSQVQTLRLTNTHDTDLVVLSKDGKDRRTLETGGTMDIDFIVVTLKDMHLDKTNPWYVMQGTSVNYVEQQHVPHFLETSGTDVVLNLRPGDRHPEPLRLSLRNCPRGWEDGPAASGMHLVGSRSVAGVPARLCPR